MECVVSGGGLVLVDNNTSIVAATYGKLAVLETVHLGERNCRAGRVTQLHCTTIQICALRSNLSVGIV